MKQNYIENKNLYKQKQKEKQLIFEDFEQYIQNYKFEFSSKKKNKHIKAIIVPHAGLYYSGKIANYAYSQIDWSLYDRIVILSTNHFSTNHTYIPENNSFFLYNNKKYFFKNITQNCFSKYKNNEIFKKEHSWAVQMPFIKKYDNIYLFLVGRYSDKQKEFINILVGQDRTLLIVNTDLYHCGKKFGNSCLNEHEMNKETIQNIISNKKLSEQSVCGKYAMKLFRYILSKNKFIHFNDKMYQTSSSSNKFNNSIIDPEQTSVGYVSMVFTYPWYYYVYIYILNLLHLNSSAT